jgi:hypothetical protein
MKNILVTLYLISLLDSGFANQSFVLSAKKVQAPPKIDGVIEAVWQSAAIADRFVQYEPNRGQLSVSNSQAMVLYDLEHLYVAFSLQDSLPPTGQLIRRDADLFVDDAVILILDTHHDHQTAYFFMTNALSTQTDGRIGDDGRTVDVTWDAPWQCASQRTEFGWTVEMSIPFTSLKYSAGDSIQWGINFGRSRRHSLETSYWAGPLNNRFRVSQAGTLIGLNIAPLKSRHQIIPYALSRFQENHSGQINAGIDIRYAITPNVSTYTTVNPDFATIEADQEQINLTRFELSLPEKRQFFIEGNELFKQRLRTFYSRRIPDITIGGKLLGKLGSWTLASFVTQSKSSQESTKATYVVARAQKDILGSSNIAFMIANRSNNGTNQGSASMDATLFFTKTLGMTAQLIRSHGQFDKGDWAYFVRPAYDSPTTHFHVRYTHLGKHIADNVNTIGFMQDDNRRELDSAFEKIFWFRSGLIERTQYDSNYNIYWSENGTLRSWQIDQTVEVELRNRIAFEVDYTEEFKKFEKEFRNRKTGFNLGYNTREFQSAGIGFEFGKNFDSDFYLWTAEAGYKVTAQLSLEYELQRLTLKPDPESESTWIHVVKANQFFTKDLYIRIFLQTNSAIDRRNVQVVFVYRYQPPFGTIQLAHQRGTADFGQRSEQGNTLFLKVTRVF